MTTLSVPAPPALNGDALAAELDAAGCPTTDLSVENVEGEPVLCLAFDGDVDEAVVAEVVAAHVPPPPPPPPPTVEELVDQRIAAAIEGADTFAQFKLNLLGA